MFRTGLCIVFGRDSDTARDDCYSQIRRLCYIFGEVYATANISSRITDLVALGAGGAFLTV